MKMLTVVGARPQFVKAAVISREILKHPSLQEVIVHTGQHYDANMSDVFFEEMDIPKPTHRLNLAGRSHGAMTGEMLRDIEAICLTEKPDLVLVYGDTNSTLAGALAAVKIHLPVAHVEAGLRSFNLCMPEEVNRILTDRISKFLFCPTETAIDNLMTEGFANFPCHIVRSGDVMLDAALFYSAKLKDFAKIAKQIQIENFALCTVHRAENTDDPKRRANIFSALREASASMPIILPLHPRTRSFLDKYDISAEGIHLLDPVGYFDMLDLLRRSKMVITDSGGVQKEAYFFDKPCITMRDETEWVELVKVGHNTLTGTDPQKIATAIQNASGKVSNWQRGLYGEGRSGQTIVDQLIKFGES